MPDNDLNPIPSEPDTPETDPEPTPVQIELTDIQRLIRETIADATAEILAARPEAQIPAGGNTPYLLDADALPTAEKIRRGLSTRSTRP